MADKQFIGKVTEKTFNNGGSIIKLSLGERDKALLTEPGWTTIAIKKSQKGTWYAEIDQYEANRQQEPAPRREPETTRGDYPTDDLPF